jgi:hypothetical protein
MACRVNATSPTWWPVSTPVCLPESQSQMMTCGMHEEISCTERERREKGAREEEAGRPRARARAKLEKMPVCVRRRKSGEELSSIVACMHASWAHLCILSAAVDQPPTVRELDACDRAALVRDPDLDLLAVHDVPDRQLSPHAP